MADIVVDSIVTKLEFDADPKVLREAQAALKQTEAQAKAAAEAADKLAAENRNLAEQTDALTQEQIKLSEKIAESTAKTDALKAEQRALRDATKEAGGATEEQKKRLAELDREIAQSQQQTRSLRDANAQLGVEKRKVAQESRKVTREQRDTSEASRKLADDQRRLSSALHDAGNAAQTQGGAMGRLTEMIGGMAGGQLAADALRAIGRAVIDLGKEIIVTGANFESLRARLKTVEGSTEAAGDAFRMIQDFAKSTPFEVENITSAFTALRVRGVQPTTATLTALGDLSSAFGLEFKDTTDAIGAAARGELDPIEKLGITAKIAGDKISLSFKGQTEVVDRSASAVTNALVKFGQMSGVQGAMAEQSMTTAGMFSNLKDTVSALFDQIAQMGVLDEAKLLMQELSSSMGSEGLAQVIADVLVIALRTLRELFTSMPQETLIEFLQAIVSLVGMMASALVDGASGGLGFMSVLYDLLAAVIEAGGTLYELIQRVQEIRAAFGDVPGPLDLLVAGLRVLAAMWEWVAAKLSYFLELLKPVLDTVENFANRLPSFSDLFSSLGAAVSGLAGDFGLLNDNLVQTKSAADMAREALDKLAAQNDYTKKTDAELQELRRRGDTKAEQEITRRVQERTGVEQLEAAEARKKKKQEETSGRAERMLDNPGRLSREQLDALAQDPNLPEKTREKAQKEIDKRDNKRTKEGRKSAKQQRDNLLTGQVQKDIEKLAMQAGQREAARAIAAGATPDEVNRRELQRRGQVQTQLETRFRETGELPPGITQDLAQVANLPNVEQVGGRLAPPVITVNNQRIEVTGNTFEANIMVEGTSATPGEIAQAAIGQARPVLFEDLGRAILNNTTTLRRG